MQKGGFGVQAQTVLVVPAASRGCCMLPNLASFLVAQKVSSLDFLWMVSLQAPLQRGKTIVSVI